MWLLRRSQLVREESMQRLARPCYTVANPSEVAKPAGMPNSLIVTWSAVGTRPFRASRVFPRETRVRALLTGEDHLRGGWRSGGRRETDLDALITHQLHTSSPMDSAAGVAPEQRCRTHRQGVQQHTHLAWLTRLVALPLTLFAQWARAAVTVTSRIHHAQAPVSALFAAPGGEAHGLLGTGGFRWAGEGSQRR